MAMIPAAPKHPVTGKQWNVKQDKWWVTKPKLWYTNIYTGLESEALIVNNGRRYKQMPKKAPDPLQKKSDILIVQLRE